MRAIILPAVSDLNDLDRVVVGEEVGNRLGGQEVHGNPAGVELLEAGRRGKGREESGEGGGGEGVEGNIEGLYGVQVAGLGVERGEKSLGRGARSEATSGRGDVSLVVPATPRPVSSILTSRDLKLMLQLSTKRCSMPGFLRPDERAAKFRFSFIPRSSFLYCEGGEEGEEGKRRDTSFLVERRDMPSRPWHSS